MKFSIFSFALTVVSTAQAWMAPDLPDIVRCSNEGANYELVLVLKSPQLPSGVTAMALKKGSATLFKVATQMYQDEQERWSFLEIPASEGSKEAKLDPATKTAWLLKFHSDDLEEGSAFTCHY